MNRGQHKLYQVGAFTFIMTTDLSDMTVLHRSSFDAVMCGATISLLTKQ